MEELFNLPQDYDAMLHHSLKVSGETKRYYIEGRLKDISLQLKNHPPVRRILDFGCGIGDGTVAMFDFFPEALEIVGVDLSDKVIFFARERHFNKNLKFITISELNHSGDFDLCFVNGVFHHILPGQRQEAINRIFHQLRQGGFLVLSENNPWNPGTLYIMSRNPFDRNAKTIPFYACRNLIRNAGFSRILQTRFLFYFPRVLSFLRTLEPYLVNFPFGGQYYVLAQK